MYSVHAHRHSNCVVCDSSHVYCPSDVSKSLCSFTERADVGFPWSSSVIASLLMAVALGGLRLLSVCLVGNQLFSSWSCQCLLSANLRLGCHGAQRSITDQICGGRAGLRPIAKLVLLEISFYSAKMNLSRILESWKVKKWRIHSLDYFPRPSTQR